MAAPVDTPHQHDWLVRVRAQVMTRDEATGGWLPLGGGGLSNVMVRKRPKLGVESLQIGTVLPAAIGESKCLQQVRGVHSHHRHTPSLPTHSLLGRGSNKLHQYNQLGGSGSQLETVGLRNCSLEDRLAEDRLLKSQPIVAQQPTNSSATGSTQTPIKYEYFIYGKRISDQSVVLSCTIKKDFQYNKVMPTFHHWVTDEKRFGLTFQTAADARAFDKGVRTAIEDLLDGLGGIVPSIHIIKLTTAPKDDEDDNIFECLNLPSDSRSSSENSTASRSHRRQADGTQLPIVPVFHLDVRQHNLYSTNEATSLSASARELLLKNRLAGSCSEEPPLFTSDPLNADNYSYVQLKKVNPNVNRPETPAGGDRSPASQSNVPGSNLRPLLQRRESNSSLKKRSNLQLYTEPPSLLGYRGIHPPPMPIKKRERDLSKKSCGELHPTRFKCRHCQEWYLESGNKPGTCKYAPDCFKTCINGITGFKCAQCMVYHCMSDAEGDYAHRPCSCNIAEDGCIKRWMGLAILSLFVPCLWCYPPLKAIHWCCLSCGVCGGKHQPGGHSVYGYGQH